jgi:hypothetical protein
MSKYNFNYVWNPFFGNHILSWDEAKNSYRQGLWAKKIIGKD